MSLSRMPCAASWAISASRRVSCSGSSAPRAVMRASGVTLLFCCVATTAASAHASGGGVEVIDVGHRTVVGSKPVLDGCDLVAVDEPAGDAFVAGSGTGRITRLAPRMGGTPIARHPPPGGRLCRCGAGSRRPAPDPDGTGWLQPFCRGTAVATTDIGTVLIDTDHAADWLTSETTLNTAGTASWTTLPVRSGSRPPPRSPAGRARSSRRSRADTVMTGNGRPSGPPAGIPGSLSLARLPRRGALPGGQLFSATGEHAGLRVDVA